MENKFKKIRIQWRELKSFHQQDTKSLMWAELCQSLAINNQQLLLLLKISVQSQQDG